MKHNLLSVEEISEVLNVPRSWIYERTRITGPGAIPCIRIGKYIRFELDEVIDWLRSQNESKSGKSNCTA